MKKALSVLLALALLISLAPAVFAADEADALSALPVRWLEYESVYWWDYEADLLLYEKDGLKGFLRGDGTPLTGADFDGVDWMIVDGGIPVQRGGKWGKIDAVTGALTVDCRYTSPQETLAPVNAVIVGAEGGPYAVAALDGTLLSDYKYWDRSASGFSYGLAAVYTTDGWGYVDDTGTEVIPCRYVCGGVEDFAADGYAWVNSPDGYNIVDRTGREVFDTPKGKILAERPWRAGHGLWGFYGDNGLVGFVEAASGEIVIAPQYRLGASPKSQRVGGVFNEAGYAQVLDENGQVIAIDLTGQRADAALAELDGTPFYTHSGGLHSFYENGKLGYMDESETVVVPAVFDFVSDFWDGKALVQSGAVWGILSDPRIPTFSDVADDAWYAPYVRYVAENGIMIGTGSGMFEPERELTDPECLTLALRLYDLQRGGDGVLPAAPADWGWITFTTADGTVTACGEDMLQWLVFSRAGGFYPAIKLLPEEADAWGQSLDCTEMTMAFDGESWTGTAHYANFEKGIGYLYIVFDPVEKGPTYERWFAIQDAYFALGRWYRDSYWNAQRLGLTDDPAFAALYGLGWHGGSNDPEYIRDYLLTPEVCTRLKFACAVSAAAGELEKRNDGVAVPDMPRDATDQFIPYQLGAVYSLYEAGILNGVDAAGNFAPEKTLTRAEAAAMVARVLDPALRLKT